MPLLHELELRRRVQVTADLTFDTGWRIGSGKEGTTMSDLGVLLDAGGSPLLPGSSIKGKLRATCESLAHALGLSACFLDYSASDVECTSDVDWYKDMKNAHKRAIEDGPERQLEWINKNTCDVCKLFGSPVRAARLRCADGRLTNPGNAIVQVRDGVVLDRDSHTAVPGLKYDYETLPAGTTFTVRFDLENPTDVDEALFGAALFEWSSGSSIGGFTSRGLGRFHLENVEVREVNLKDPKQLLAFLTKTKPTERMQTTPDWQQYFTRAIDHRLNGGNNP